MEKHIIFFKFYRNWQDEKLNTPTPNPSGNFQLKTIKHMENSIFLFLIESFPYP